MGRRILNWNSHNQSERRYRVQGRAWLGQWQTASTPRRIHESVRILFVTQQTREQEINWQRKLKKGGRTWTRVLLVNSKNEWDSAPPNGCSTRTEEGIDAVCGTFSLYYSNVDVFVEIVESSSCCWQFGTEKGNWSQQTNTGTLRTWRKFWWLSVCCVFTFFFPAADSWRLLKTSAVYVY